MYRSDLDAKDKSGALIAVAAVHVGLLFLLLHLSGTLAAVEPQAVLRVFDLSDPPPPPAPPPPPPPRQQQARTKRSEGGSAPANIKSQATPIVAPTPRIRLPTPAPIPVAETPAQGTAPTQGAARVAGPGTGAGGLGNGSGSGSGGNGAGAGGGDSGVAEPPHLASPVLTAREIPHELLDRWPAGVPVFLRLRVNPQGYVSECNVLRGTGQPGIDAVMCNIAHDRLRFQPALNRSGQPVAGWFGYAQRPPR